MATKKPKKVTAKSILAECQAVVEKSLGKKRLSNKVKTEFRKRYLDMIERAMAKWPAPPDPATSKQLAQWKRDQWERDSKNVLRVARKLGKVAAALSDGQIVLNWAFEAASIAAQSDPGCPVGQGRYCDPSAN